MHRLLQPIVVSLLLVGVDASYRRHDDETIKSENKNLRGKQVILSPPEQRRRDLNFMEFAEDNIFALRAEPDDTDILNIIDCTNECGVGCPSGFKCTVFSDSCLCLPAEDGSCISSTDAPACGGTCGLGEVCVNIPTTDICDCRPDPCIGQCEEDCGDGSTCALNGDVCECVDQGTPVPTSQPSVSGEPSTAPTRSLEPSISFEPSMSYKPSISYEPSSSNAPSSVGTGTGTTVSSNTPSQETTTFPSVDTSGMPTVAVSRFNTDVPSGSVEPSLEPSRSLSPSHSFQPSQIPSQSNEPSLSSMPSIGATGFPTEQTTISAAPSDGPSVSASPSGLPTTSFSPTITPKPSSSTSPSGKPTKSDFPSTIPSSIPSEEPTQVETFPPSLSASPSEQPTTTLSPTNSPAPSASARPSGNPTASGAPSVTPSVEPTLGPTATFEPTFVSGNATARVSGVFGDPHIITFDDLEFDCQAHGEFTMITSLGDSEFEIQERFTAVETDCGQASVSTGFVVQADNLPKVQVSIPRSSGVTSEPVVNGCPVNFFSGGGLLNTPDPELNAFGVTITIDGDDNEISVLYPSKLLVISTVRNSMDFGCFLRVQVMLPIDYLAGETLIGLLGQPDDDITNDWLDKSGNVVEQPTNEQDLLFGWAYDYCRINWCISEESDSLFTYVNDENFDSISGCNVEYSSEELESKVDDELANGGLLKDICCDNSDDPDDCDFGCLIDGVCGSVQDAQNAADDQEAIFELKEIVRSPTTPEPSSQPSQEPSVSPEPSSVPSISPAPSFSPAPTDSPSPSEVPTISAAPSNIPSISVTASPTVSPTFIPTDSGGDSGGTVRPTMSPVDSGGTIRPTMSPVDTGRERPTPGWKARRPTTPSSEWFTDLLRKWKRAKRKSDSRYRKWQRSRRRRRFRRRRRSSWNRSQWNNRTRSSSPWWKWWK